MRLVLLDEEHAFDPDGRVWVRIAGRWELGERRSGPVHARPAEPRAEEPYCEWDEEDD